MVQILSLPQLKTPIQPLRNGRVLHHPRMCHMCPPSMDCMEHFRKCGTLCSAANGVGAVIPGAEMSQVKLHCCGDPDRMLLNSRCELDSFVSRCRCSSTSKTLLDIVLCSWQLATEARSLTTLTACTMPLANIKQNRTHMRQQTAEITLRPQHPTLTTTSHRWSAASNSTVRLFLNGGCIRPAGLMSQRTTSAH